MALYSTHKVEGGTETDLRRALMAPFLSSVAGIWEGNPSSNGGVVFGDCLSSRGKGAAMVATIRREATLTFFLVLSGEQETREREVLRG